MKKKLLLIFSIAVVALTASCERVCHCYAYDGSHKYFTAEELDEAGSSCVGMESAFYGLKYSLCEWDLE